MVGVVESSGERLEEPLGRKRFHAAAGSRQARQFLLKARPLDEGTGQVGGADAH